MDKKGARKVPTKARPESKVKREPEAPAKTPVTEPVTLPRLEVGTGSRLILTKDGLPFAEVQMQDIMVTVHRDGTLVDTAFRGYTVSAAQQSAMAPEVDEIVERNFSGEEVVRFRG